MGTKVAFGQPNLGRLWLPETTVSYAGAGKCKREYDGVVVASQLRPRWSIDGLARLPERTYPPEDGKAQLKGLVGLIDPLKFACETIWASVTHNARVDMGCSIQHRICFGVVGQTTNGFFDDMALGGAGGTEPNGYTTGITIAKTDLSLGIITADVSTNEHTAAGGIGLARTQATHQTYGGPPPGLNDPDTSDLYKSFSVLGTGKVYSTGLFDSPTVIGSHLYVEDNFGTMASVINGDTLQVTWTITF